MRTRHILISGIGAAVLTLAAAPATADTTDGATLAVLHAVPGTPVDVYVDGELTVDDFEPGDLAGPLDLPAGSYSVAITAADAEDDSEPVNGPIDLALESGGSHTAVAHLDTEGAAWARSSSRRNGSGRPSPTT